MHNDEWNNASLPGDFQSKPPTAPGSQGEARLIQEVQAMYRWEKDVSIERVWTHLAGQRAGTDATVFASQQPEVSGSQTQRLLSERNTKMQLRDRVPVSQKGLPRFLSLLAATLVCVVIVGSLLLVLNLKKGIPHLSTTGSQSTAIPLSSPECRDSTDQDEQKLCLEHVETFINIPKNFGTHKVVFLRAYADTSRLLLVYTTSDPATSDAISFESLNIQSKIKLSSSGSTSYQNPKAHQAYYVADFATQNIPIGTTQVQIQSIVDAFSGGATPLEITIPFHMTQKTITVNKTVINKGISLTLERVVDAGSETLFYFKSSQALNNGLFIHTISVNGHPFTYNGSQIDSGVTVGSPDLVIHLHAALDAPGTWMLKIFEGGSSASNNWTFTFTKAAS